MDYKSNRNFWNVVIVVVLLGAISLWVSYYVDWLWFKSLNYGSVYSTTLINKVLMILAVFLVSFAFLWGNLYITRRYASESQKASNQDPQVDTGNVFQRPGLNDWMRFLQIKNNHWIYIGTSLLGAFLLSSSLGDKWIVVQQFVNRVVFNIADPIFGYDIGWYFFNLSFYQLVYSILMSILVMTLIIVAVFYLINASADLFFSEWIEYSQAKSHLAALIAVIVLLKAWGYRLATYEVLFSSHGTVYGATYTDIYARLLSNRVLMWVAIATALIILASIFARGLKIAIWAIVGWLVVVVCLGGLYPVFVQKLVVQPNEFNKEKPFIENAIKYTRQAYELDEVDTSEFKIDYKLTLKDLANNSATINNVRLWDWSPLGNTYRSLQELRPYYVFSDVDIDRYYVDGRYRQVMLSAREMDQNSLPEQAKTWVNQKLMFTHGYGLVMSPVTEVAQEGFPQFFIKDIPPQFSTNIQIVRPEVYFGEKTDTYVVVNTNQQEFDYPMGEENMYSLYEGENGIKINSWTRRFMLSWFLKDYKMILSSDINNQSQVLIYRNIVTRVNKIAPYLSYDQDPYIVVNNDGRLFWILDAYTYSGKYPYSQPYDNLGNNYIRNSVKVVCDAYTGEMNFYVADPGDPMVQTYQKIFPQLFKSAAEMPEGLKPHVRYPEDLFSIQAEIYRSYHMTDPAVFYNKEDTWVIPGELSGGKEQQIEPYYIIMRLPGEPEAEYILMLPYTPKGRPNMIAWMCVRMDGMKYGHKLVYTFPKQETVFGPMQIESRINQDTEISRQLTLWDQKGSSTLRGNLLVIPINNSILYIEPLYLQAVNSQMPELKRIIAAYGNKVVMDETLDKALLALFGTPGQTTTGIIKPTPGVSTPAVDTVPLLSQQARQYYDLAQERLKAGDWTGYGSNLEKLNDVLKRLETLSNQ